VYIFKNVQNSAYFFPHYIAVQKIDRSMIQPHSFYTKFSIKFSHFTRCRIRTFAFRILYHSHFLIGSDAYDGK